MSAMIKSSLDKEINKEICNAFGCSKNATKKINVSAGTFGKISLNLCNNCVNLFKKELQINWKMVDSLYSQRILKK